MNPVSFFSTNFPTVCTPIVKGAAAGATSGVATLKIFAYVKFAAGTFYSAEKQGSWPLLGAIVGQMFLFPVAVTTIFLLGLVLVENIEPRHGKYIHAISSLVSTGAGFYDLLTGGAIKPYILMAISIATGAVVKSCFLMDQILEEDDLDQPQQAIQV